MRTLLLFLIICTAQTVKSQSFLQGYYIDQNGTKIEGEIRYNFRNTKQTIAKKQQYFTFRSSSVKKTTIYADMVQFFMVAGDKYVPAGGSETIFLRLVFENPVKVYARYHEVYRGGNNIGVNGLLTGVGPYREIGAIYSYGDNPDDAREVTKENFAEVMTKAMADVPQMGQLIKDGVYNLNNVEEMIKTYKNIKNRKP